MQTDTQAAVQKALQTLYELAPRERHQVLTTMFSAVYEHLDNGDVSTLQRMARDVSFTMAAEGSEAYRKLVENGPHEPAKEGTPVSEALDRLAM